MNPQSNELGSSTNGIIEWNVGMISDQLCVNREGFQ
jgi:hypothetical protein